MACAKMVEPHPSVGWIVSPERLVQQAEALLVSQRWEEVVVGLALVSGRCVVEVLKTGVLMPKTRYSFVFTVHQEQADQVLGPFELPTLVEGQTVLLAWQRVRTLVDCEALSAHEICKRYREQVVQCAKAQFGQEVPLVCEQGDWYTPLYAQIYPLLATRYYCPKGKDQTWFAAIIRGLAWPVPSEMKTVACACCGQCCSGVYRVGDGVKTVESEVGLRLDQEGVELLECVRIGEELACIADRRECFDSQEGVRAQCTVRKSSPPQGKGQVSEAERPSKV